MPLVACFGASFVSTVILLFVARARARCSYRRYDVNTVEKNRRPDSSNLSRPDECARADSLLKKNSPAIYVARSRFTA